MLNNPIVTGRILFCFTFFTIFQFPPATGAQTKSLSDLSFEKCVESGLIEDQLDDLFASDNNSVFVTLLQQKLVAFDRHKLTFNWKTDFGGVISNLVVFQNELYLTSENKPDKSDKPDLHNNEQREVSSNTEIPQSIIWLVNKNTGLPSRKVPVPVGHITSLLSVGENLVLIGSEGEICLFNSELQMVRETKIGDAVEPIRTGIILQEKILIASGGHVWSYDPKTNRIEQLLKSKENISALAANKKGDFVYGDKMGNVKYYNSLRKKTDWNYRTGAGITSIIDSKTGMVINSADNFVYLISDRGALKWKKRFKDSPDQIINQENLLFLVLGRDRLVSIINSDSGKDLITVEIPLPEGNLLSLFQLKSLPDTSSLSFALKAANKMSIYNTNGHCS